MPLKRWLALAPLLAFVKLRGLPAKKGALLLVPSAIIGLAKGRQPAGAKAGAQGQAGAKQLI